MINDRKTFFFKHSIFTHTIWSSISNNYKCLNCFHDGLLLDWYKKYLRVYGSYISFHGFCTKNSVFFLILLYLARLWLLCIGTQSGYNSTEVLGNRIKPNKTLWYAILCLTYEETGHKIQYIIQIRLPQTLMYNRMA